MSTLIQSVFVFRATRQLGVNLFMHTKSRRRLTALRFFAIRLLNFHFRLLRLLFKRFNLFDGFYLYAQLSKYQNSYYIRIYTNNIILLYISKNLKECIL